MDREKIDSIERLRCIIALLRKPKWKFVVEERRMMTNRLQKLTGLSASLCLGFALTARADVVTDWNAIAVQTILAGGRPAGGSPFLDIATVHLAVHDAVAAIDGQFRPYHVVVPGASGLAGGGGCEGCL
jgi:hypothetical protein